MRVLVFDIETIPDIQGAKLVYHLEHLNDQDAYQAVVQLRREKNGQDFLPLHLQKIIAISLVLADAKDLKVWSLGTIESNEKELIERFFSGINKYTPTLVSWNGTGFDLPVLHYRAMINKVSAPAYWEMGEHDSSFKWNNYINRYHYRHLDLMDVLASYQSKAYAPLDEIASLLGFPGKMGMHGSKVFEAYQNGMLREVRNYCETDVLNTYAVYLRFELMRGQLTQQAYNDRIEKMIESLTSDTKLNHLVEFASKIK